MRRFSEEKEESKSHKRIGELRILIQSWISLTKRETKGFNFERIISKALMREDHLFTSNSSNSGEWKRRQGKVDFKVEGIEIEAKFSHAKIFPSWIKRDWITRFSKEARLRIAVINRGMKLPEESKRILEQHSVLVVYFDRLVSVLRMALEILKKRGNKLIEVVPSILRKSFSTIEVVWFKLKRILSPILTIVTCLYLISSLNRMKKSDLDGKDNHNRTKTDTHSEESMEEKGKPWIFVHSSTLLSDRKLRLDELSEELFLIKGETVSLEGRKYYVNKERGENNELCHPLSTLQ